MYVHACRLFECPPFPPCRYELCNLYGLYVVDEANVETHGFDPALANNPLNPAASPAWLNAIVGEWVSLAQPPPLSPYVSLQVIRQPAVPS